MGQMFVTTRFMASHIQTRLSRSKAIWVGVVLLAVFTPALPLLCLPSADVDLVPFTEEYDDANRSQDCVYFNKATGKEHLRLACTAEKFITNQSESILPDFIVRRMTEFHEGLAAVRFSDGKWYFIDESGNVAVKTGFDEADRFSGGLARIKQNGQFGFIDRTGKIVIQPQYAKAGRFVSGLAFNQCNKSIFLYGFIDKTGKQAIPCSFQEAANFTSDGLARARKWDLYGFVDLKGKAVLNFAYKWAGHFNANVTYMFKGDNFVLIDRTGRQLYTVQRYNMIGDFGDGVLPIRLSSNLRWGYSDVKGNMMIPFVFAEAYSFHRGLALVKGPSDYKDKSYQPAADVQEYGKLAWFYIDKTGRRLFR